MIWLGAASMTLGGLLYLLEPSLDRRGYGAVAAVLRTALLVTGLVLLTVGMSR